MHQNSVVKKVYRSLLALAGAAIMVSMPMCAEASPISQPDISSRWFGSNGQYVGFNTQYQDGTNSAPFQNWGSFLVIPGVGGTISITGSFLDPASNSLIDSTTDPSQSLLTGTITQVVWDTATVYEFLFNITSGAAANLFGGIGAIGRTTMTDFSQGDRVDGVADTVGHSAPVPEPASLTLLLAGGAALVVTRRRQTASAQA